MCNGTGSAGCCSAAACASPNAVYHAVRLGRRRQVDRRLGEGELPFGTAEKVIRVFGGERDAERPRVGQADILDRHAHQAPGDVERVLPARQHARQPIERAIGVRSAHRLVQRGNQIEVLLAALVVDGGAVVPAPGGSPLGKREGGRGSVDVP